MELFTDKSDRKTAIYLGSDSGAICVETQHDYWGKITHYVNLTPRQKRNLASELIASADKEEHDEY